MTEERLIALVERGWRLNRDGSTSTAQFAWDDPGDAENGWEILVLHTEGHVSRFTLNVLESGLTERSPDEAKSLAEALAEAQELLRGWKGELPPMGALDGL